MPYEPLPSLFPGTLEEEVEEEEVVAPPTMPYVPTSVPTPPPPTVYPRVVPPTAPPPSSPPLATPPPPVIPSPLPPSILPAPTPPSSSSSTAPPDGEGGTVVSLSVMITDGQRLMTKQLQDKSSMDGVQQSGGQETREQQTGEKQIGEQQIGEEQIGEEQIGEQQTGELQTGEQEMWGIRDGGRVLVSGTITAPPLRCSTRITRGVPPGPMLWYDALDGELLGAGWKKSQVDEALYFESDAEGEMCWLLVYVDDLLAASCSQSMLGELRDLLQSAFQLREISPVEKYLGLQLVRNRPTRRLWLHQGAYVDKVHRRFFDEEQPLQVPRTPLSSNLSSVQTFEDVGWQSRQEEEYRQKVGSLDVALEFGGGPESLELVGYADADDAGDKQNRTSTGGYVFVLGGAAVSWASQRIRCATLSSTESEYVAAVEARKEARRLRFLLAEFQLLRSEEPTTLFVDNSSAITVAGGMGLKGSLKHMERCHMWLQHMVKRRKLQLLYIPTSKQPADYLTKALHFPAFSCWFEAVGQVRLSSEGSET
ncbi:unnamed protein product [Closterium sp. NIES-54]